VKAGITEKVRVSGLLRASFFVSEEQYFEAGERSTASVECSTASVERSSAAGEQISAAEIPSTASVERSTASVERSSEAEKCSTAAVERSSEAVERSIMDEFRHFLPAEGWLGTAFQYGNPDFASSAFEAPAFGGEEAGGRVNVERRTLNAEL